MSSELLSEIEALGTFLSALVALAVAAVNMLMLREMKLSRQVSTKPRLVLLPNSQRKEISFDHIQMEINFGHPALDEKSTTVVKEKRGCFELKNVGNAPAAQCSIHWRLRSAAVDYLRSKQADWGCEFSFYSDADGPYAISSMKFARSEHYMADGQDLVIPIVVASPQTDGTVSVFESALETHIALMALSFATKLLKRPENSGISNATLLSELQISVVLSYFDLYGIQSEVSYLVAPGLPYAVVKNDLSIDAEYTVNVTPTQVLMYD